MILIKTDLNNFHIDTDKDQSFSISLPIGILCKTEDTYYVIGFEPIGEFNVDFTTEYEDYKHVFKDENDELGHMEKYTYSVTKYISLLTTDYIINYLIEYIKNSSVTISDSELFLKSPIVTNGVGKVFVNNCVAHIEGSEGFLSVDGMQSGSVICYNEIKPIDYHKYGSQNKKDFLKKAYYPKSTEYHIKVGKEDTVIKSKTDKRGYPASCGIEHKEKDIIVIIKGDKEYLTVDEIKEMIEDANKKGIKEIPITKQIRIKGNEELHEEVTVSEGE